MDKITEKKKQLRKEIKQAVRELSPQYRALSDEQIQNHIITWEAYQHAETIFCFVGTDSEINTVPILEHILKSGKRLGVPKCIGKGIMEVYEIHSLEELKTGAYGIREPGEAAVRIAPEEIDLSLVPCLSSSQDGWRLGYGGGFYDRYLIKTKAVRAVLCRGRLMREEIPGNANDLRMDYVITEKGIVNIQ